MDEQQILDSMSEALINAVADTEDNSNEQLNNSTEGENQEVVPVEESTEENTQTTETTENKDEQAGEPTETNEVNAKPIVRAKGESDASFNIRKRLTEIKEAKRNSSGEEREKYAALAKDTEKELAQQRRLDKQQYQPTSQTQQNLSPEDAEKEKLAQLMRELGFVREDDLENLRAQQYQEERNSRIVGGFIQSKPILSEDKELAEAFLEAADSFGVDWQSLTDNQMTKMLEFVYQNSDIEMPVVKQVENPVKTAEKALQIQEKIKQTQYSGVATKPVNTAPKQDKATEDAWKALGY